MRQIYFDYAAATPLDEQALVAMLPYLSEKFYNPSALYNSAREVRQEYETARHQLAMAIGAKQNEIIITAGASESINLAVQGIMKKSGGEVITSNIEHDAVLKTAQQFIHIVVSADQKGIVSAEAVQGAISSRTTLISVGYCNNELGTIQPIRGIADVIENERQQRLRNGNKLPIYLHTDASQAAGLIDISVSRLGVDLMTLNSAKCYGPKQTGLLWVRAGIMLEPIIYGGSQEGSLRAGTENVAGAVGFAKALSVAITRRKDESTRLAKLRDELQRRLSDGIPEVVINGHSKRHAPHILHFSVPGLDGERAVFALDQRGVQVATGSACAANNGLRSHVLSGVGMSDELADGSIRVSLGKFTTMDDIEIGADLIINTILEEIGR